MNTDPINLEPRYTSNELPGKCIKCLAEQELDNCLRELLRDETDGEKAKEKFEMLVAFLKSPASQKLRDESEKYLADGKHVKIRVNFLDGKIEYRMDIK